MAKPTEQELLDEKLQWAQTEIMSRFNAEEAKYLLVALAYLISGGDRLQSVWYLLGLAYDIMGRKLADETPPAPINIGSPLI